MPSDATLSPSAVRTRRYRERRDRGAVVISLEVDSNQLEALVYLGLLNEADVTNRTKVHEAVDFLLFDLAEGGAEITWVEDE